MKIIHLSYSNYIGGASIAANRIHYSLCKNNINSELWVNESLYKKSYWKEPCDKVKKKLRRYITWPINTNKQYFNSISDLQLIKKLQ